MARLHRLIVILLISLAVAALAGCSSPSPSPTPNPNRVAQNGDLVSVDYIGSYTNGTIFDTSIESVALQHSDIYSPMRNYGPLNFTLGSGEMIPGFDQAVVGMKIGETKNVTLSPALAYGDYNQSLIMPVNLSTFTAQNITPYPNLTVYNAYGQPLRVDRVDLNNSTVYVDFNSPMAGKTLLFSITLRAIS